MPLTKRQKTERAILRKAAALIKKGWCQGSNGETRSGTPIFCPWSEIKDKAAPKPARYCSVGALRTAAVMSGLGPYNKIVEGVRDKLDDACPFDLVCFNDRVITTKKDVLAVFKQVHDSIRSKKTKP